MIYFYNKEYSEKDVEKAKRNAPNAMRRCYADITRKLDGFNYGLYRGFDGTIRPSIMELISVAHHYGVKTSTISAGLADDLAMYLNSASADMNEEDYITLALSESRDEWEDDETPSPDVDSVVINHFEDYLESVYYSPHVQKLLKDQEFKDLLCFLNIDKTHAFIDSGSDWLEIY